MKFKEVIFVVLIMLIFAMVMLMYIVINDSIKASSVPIISNNIENITCGNKNNDGDNANNKVNKIENLLINKEDSNSAEKNQKENEHPFGWKTEGQDGRDCGADDYRRPS